MWLLLSQFLMHGWAHVISLRYTDWHSASEQCEKVKRQCRLRVEKQTGWPDRVKLETGRETGDAASVWMCIYVRMHIFGGCGFSFLHFCVCSFVSGETVKWLCPQTNIHLTQRFHVSSHLFKLLDKCEQNRSHCLYSELYCTGLTVVHICALDCCPFSLAQCFLYYTLPKCTVVAIVDIAGTCFYVGLVLQEHLRLCSRLTFLNCLAKVWSLQLQRMATLKHTVQLSSTEV